MLNILKKEFRAVSKDWEGTLYCGITLEWNHEEGWVDILMQGYIHRILQKYKQEEISPIRPRSLTGVKTPNSPRKDLRDIQ